MRLHRLTVRAFGPFADEVGVDFDTLTEAGLFLLTGPTGAGKTSVLDAVCFGLYGVVPGERNQARSLRSDHAAAGMGPRVELEVTIRDRRLRFVRSPEWMRDSARAKSGHVREQARVVLEELDAGEWVALSSRLDEVGDLVNRLVGLTAGQFCQVVLLPQGQFHSFLAADAGQRRRVLEGIFDTKRFDEITRWLAQHRRTVAEEYDAQLDQVRQTASRISEVVRADLAPDVAPDVVADPSALLEWLGPVHVATRAAADASAAALESRQVLAKQTRHALDTAITLAERQEQFREARARLGELDALAEVYAEHRSAVDKAREAKSLVPLLQLVEATESALAEASPEAARAIATFAERGLLEGDADVAALDRLDRQLTRRLADADGAVLLEARVGDLANQREVLTAEEAELAESLDRLGMVTAELPTRIAAAEERLQTARDARSQMDSLAAAADRAKQVLSAARSAAELSQQLGTLQAHELRQREAVAARKATWLDLREARLDGFAAELAGRLEDDVACPVCGALEHPSPAPAGEQTVSEADEQDALQALHDAEELLRSAEGQMSLVQADLAAAQALSRGYAPDGAANELEAAAADLQRARDAASELAGAETGLAAAKREMEGTTTRLAGTQQELARVRQSLAELHIAIGAAEETLDAQLGDAETAAALLATATSDQQLVQDAAARLRVLIDRQSRQADGAQRLEAALEPTTFGSASDAGAAALTDPEIADRETLIRGYELEVKTTRRTLEDPVFVAAAAEPIPDLAVLTATAEGARAALDEALTGHSSAERRADRLDQLAQEATEQVELIEPVSQRLEVATAVASLCSGTSADNTLKAELSSYVLAARLEQVVAAANERLASISAGRYTLEHSMHRGVGDKRGGLSLRVMDGHTGVSRDPATLSGGETFYVSLALALGLADLVATEAGGAELSTLFVDEGFGSLDADTLDEVLDELDALRSGGRTVGLVSHLAELRQRIPTQLTVVKSRHGSTVQSQAVAGNNLVTAPAAL